MFNSIKKLYANVYVIPNIQDYSLPRHFSGDVQRLSNKILTQVVKSGKLVDGKYLTVTLLSNNSESYGKEMGLIYPSHNPYLDKDREQYEEIYNLCKIKNIRSLTIRYDINHIY
jgi:hypothetical protein